MRTKRKYRTLIKQLNFVGGGVRSPKFKFYFDVNRIDGSKIFLDVYYKGSNFRIALVSGKITSPTRIEKWLLDKITRTNYAGITKIVDHKYELDLKSLPYSIVKLLFKEALKGGVNKSWLVPLQDLLIIKRPSYEESGLRYAEDAPENVNFHKKLHDYIVGIPEMQFAAQVIPNL